MTRLLVRRRLAVETPFPVQAGDYGPERVSERVKTAQHDHVLSLIVEERVMIKWVREGALARGCRPGEHSDDPHNVPRVEVELWIEEAQRKGVRSIICLLSDEELYDYPGIDLIAAYELRGFIVRHIPADDFQNPPLPVAALQDVWAAYQGLPHPVLIHCRLGIARTGHAIEHILRHLSSDS